MKNIIFENSIEDFRVFFFEEIPLIKHVMSCTLVQLTLNTLEQLLNNI